ncbi:hypothetical protein BDR06DRAFT_955396 [Suillus hirtellus]|nr:hypothetical protein BDR06DRAFT_955396 [Suillus hirtellus]
MHNDFIFVMKMEVLNQCVGSFLRPDSPSTLKYGNETYIFWTALPLLEKRACLILVYVHAVPCTQQMAVDVLGAWSTLNVHDVTVPCS